MNPKRHPSVKQLRNKRKQSVAERRRKSLMRKEDRTRMLMYKRNDNLLTSKFRQKLRLQTLGDIRSQIFHTMKPALLISTLKAKINKATREAINTEFQNTMNFIYTARNVIEKMFVKHKLASESDVSRAEIDSEDAKRWIARIYLLFKSFDFDQDIDKSKFIPTIETQELSTKEDVKLNDIKAEEQRYLGQQKSLKMEIEDNEIRLIAKEQILRERIDEQQEQIYKLNKQILDLKRKMGLLPTVSSVRRVLTGRSSRKLSVATTTKPTSQRSFKGTNVLIIQ